ncbi:cupredoxin family protein [Bradyrhizobium sp. NAS80.1]|uniref:cupredoxin domain-containing protein n=1 Tax=Bradyrhizobium sp. NAS80.1 TaxID=1680159 RepID=UPI000B12AFA3
MRLWITRLFRKKAVLADAALYMLCALTSSGALAYTENNGVSHCLSEAGSPARAHTVQTESSHFHPDGAWLEHHSNGTQQNYDGKVVADNCCRILCISAITPVVPPPAPELGAPRHFAPEQEPPTIGAGARLYAHEGEEHFSAGEPGDPKKPFRVVEIAMRENDSRMSYHPNALEVKRGEQIKFVITNAGLLAHEFILADTADNLKHAALMKKYPDMEHDDPNGKTVQPGVKAEMLWRFTKTGTFEFSCLIPGHREAGMVGTVTVK